MTSSRPLLACVLLSLSGCSAEGQLLGGAADAREAGPDGPSADAQLGADTGDGGVDDAGDDQDAGIQDRSGDARDADEVPDGADVATDPPPGDVSSRDPDVAADGRERDADVDSDDVRMDVPDLATDIAPDLSSDADVDAPDAIPDGGGDSSSDAGPGSEQWSVDFVGAGDNVDGEAEIVLYCDDAASGPSAHERCDVGAGSFTFELWLKGDSTLNDNRGGPGLDSEVFSYSFVASNIFLDRDVFCGSCDGRDFGAGLMDGRVVFSLGDAGSGAFTIQGSIAVVESPAVWHHVALVYDDAPAGNQVRIYVDGSLDYASTATLEDANRSIPDSGCTAGCASSARRQVALVFGAEKHGFDGISFDGQIDRIRIWDAARTDSEIGASWNSDIDCATPGLVAKYALEEGAGAIVRDACSVSPDAAIDFGSTDRVRWASEGAPISL